LRTPARAALLPLVLVLVASGTPARADSVYRWVDAEGVIHISSAKPPGGVQAERIEVRSSPSKRPGTGTSRSSGASGGSASSASQPRATPEQVAARDEVLGSLRTRECVIALEALDRLTSGTQPTSTTEIRRLQQTAELNCSKDPARRREQEDMAARLRVANSPACVEARNQLAALLAPGSKAAREQVKAQQDFVDSYCSAPVR
jgi:hypothetical protein